MPGGITSSHLKQEMGPERENESNDIPIVGKGMPPKPNGAFLPITMCLFPSETPEENESKSSRKRIQKVRCSSSYIGLLCTQEQSRSTQDLWFHFWILFLGFYLLVDASHSTCCWFQPLWGTWLNISHSRSETSLSFILKQFKILNLQSNLIWSQICFPGLNVLKEA